MTSQAQRTVLLSVVFLCGCQSMDSLVPWQSKNTPKYTAEELAALDGPNVAAENRSKSKDRIAPPDDAAKTASPNIVQASYNPDSPAMPGSAERLQQLVRAGQAIVASGQTDALKLAEARNNFEQALAMDQRHSAAHHGMAIVADLQQDYGTAEFHYKQALSANPSDPNLLNDLGYSYVLQNRFAEATNYLNRVLQISPQFERAKVNMALMSLKRGNRQDAQQILSGMYDPTKAQATLVKLEQSVQEMQTVQMPSAMPLNNGQMPIQTPYNSGQMPPQNYPPHQSNSVAQDVLRRMQQERQQGNAMANNSPPIHVYPPGVVVDESMDNMPQDVAQNQNYGGNTPPQSWADHQQTMGQGNQQIPMANYPGSQQPQQQFGNQQFAPRMMPRNSAGYPQTAQNNTSCSMQGMNMTAGPGYQSSPRQNQSPNYQNGQLQNPQPSQGYGMNSPQSAQNAPFVGLNAGPGALFPINGSNGQSAGNGGMSASGSEMNRASYPQNQSMNQSQMNPGQGGFLAPVGSQNSYPVQTGTQYPNAISNVSSSRMLDGGFQNQSGARPAQLQYQNQNQNPQYQSAQQFQAVPPHMNSVPMNSGMQGMGVPTQNTGNPLEAYERQLQNLDSQYNRAIQQMDGSSLGVSTVPAQY